MCVIIYIPKTATITKAELEDAWDTNPHGAGYSIQKNGRVIFKRGFMDFDEYYKEIENLIGRYNLMLHFRISTSKEVNRVQTHPYKKGNVTVTEGSTTRPVICMNGIISGQKEYKDCNDTMSYIADHEETFAIITQDILNIIEEATGAKWAVMKPNEVLLSSKFTKENGRYYSNKNHLLNKWVTNYYGGYTRKKQKVLSDFIDQKLIGVIRKDKELFHDLLDFVEFWCNGTQGQCNICTKCLSTAKTLRDVKIVLNENYYFEEEIDYNDDLETYYNEYNELDFDLLNLNDLFY